MHEDTGNQSMEVIQATKHEADDTHVPDTCTSSKNDSAIPHDGSSRASLVAPSKQSFLRYDQDAVDNYITMGADGDFTEQEFGRKRKMNQKRGCRKKRATMKDDTNTVEHRVECEQGVRCDANGNKDNLSRQALHITAKRSVTNNNINRSMNHKCLNEKTRGDTNDKNNVKMNFFGLDSSDTDNPVDDPDYEISTDESEEDFDMSNVSPKRKRNKKLLSRKKPKMKQSSNDDDDICLKKIEILGMVQKQVIKPNGRKKSMQTGPAPGTRAPPLIDEKGTYDQKKGWCNTSSGVKHIKTRYFSTSKSEK